MIVAQLSEDGQLLYVTEDKEARYPRLKSNVVLGKKTVEMHIEEVIVMVSLEFLDALIGLLACYYAFNLEYPQTLKSTLAFFHSLEINDGLKKDAKVRK